jgi:ABC-2 type transport system permease protein/sodium transport system permease protein
MNPPPRTSLTAAAHRLLRLMRKELSESLRDRRTILTLVLMPVLLYPILAMAFQQMLRSRRLEKDRTTYVLGMASTAEAEALREYWRYGRDHLFGRHVGAVKKGEKPPTPAYLEPQPELEWRVRGDLDEALRAGAVDVVVRLRPPGAFRINIGRFPFLGRDFLCELVYREGSAKGREAVRYLETLTADANAVLVSQRLNASRRRLLRITALRRRLGEQIEKELAWQHGDPVMVRASTLTVPPAKKTDLTPVLVPLVLILMTMTGAVYPAIDLTAGERERGTLEILVAAPIPRLSVLLAKYVAVLTVAVLTALVNLASMTATLYATGFGEMLFADRLNLVVLVQVLALLLLFAAFFSAVALALTSFARSFKEAQAYLVPLMLLCLAPGMMALWPGLNLAGPLAVAPLINIVLLARDVFEGVATPAVAGVVVVTTLVYALAAVGLAARIFGAEAVLSNAASSWADLFRRPSRPRPAAEPAQALLCLALMFPAYFLLMNGLAQVKGLDVAGRLGLTALANVVLFGGFPLAALWLGRVGPSSSLRVLRPGWQACSAAVLLGLCLWPFAHEVLLVLRRAGFSTLGPEHGEKVRAFLQECREYSPLLLVGVMAVVPAVVEELSFRGYLFTALLGRGGRPWRAIFSSAALFSLFHLLVTDALAVERLPPSLLLGVVLAWLCYRSGSVVPGMVLHALHNGSLTLLAYYEPRLVEVGWALSAEDHLPPWLLAGAAVGALLGALLVWRLKPPAPAEEGEGEAVEEKVGEPALPPS